MFDNIGNKIKILAKIISIVGIAVSVIYGLYFMTRGSFGYGLTITLIGSVSSWISSFFAYGFGELISNSEIIKKSIESNESYNKEITEILNKETNKKEVKEKSSLADEKIDLKCPTCGVVLSYSENSLKEKSSLNCPFCKNEIKIKK